METKKQGIELVKKSIKFIYDTTIEGVEVLRDKKINLGEILGFGDNLYSGINLALKWPELVSEIVDIDTEEGADLVAYVGDLIKNATSDEIDVIIDNAIIIITKEIEIYNENIVPIIDIIRKK